MKATMKRTVVCRHTLLRPCREEEEGVVVDYMVLAGGKVDGEREGTNTKWRLS